MIVHLEFENGSNPWVSLNNNEVTEMVDKLKSWLKRYNILFEWKGDVLYGYVTQERKATLKEVAREIGIILQDYMSSNALYWSDVAVINVYLYQLGKKYKLINEFKENGLL